MFVRDVHIKKEEDYCTMISGEGRLSSALIPHKEVLSDGACEKCIMWWQVLHNMIHVDK